MQVTLNQSEIETAITNYISDIMTVKDGMAVNITLRATRGEEGTTAVIDILPIGQAPAPVAAPAPTPAPVSPRKATVVKKPEPTAAAAPAPTPIPPSAELASPESGSTAGADGTAGDAQGAGDAGEGDTTGSDAGGAPFVADTTQGTLNQEVAQAASNEAEAKPAERPKSLFANLRKPVNQ